MDTQDKDKAKPITGGHIAPKGHSGGCPCCVPEDISIEEDE